MTTPARSNPLADLLKLDFWKKRLAGARGLATQDELGVHTIFIETISKCNLRCTYCHRTTNQYGSKNKKMDFDLFRRIIDQIDVDDPIFANGARSLQGGRPALYLHGFGEPTLHPEITKQLAYASESGKFYEVRFVSNLLAVPKERYAEYFEAGLTHLYVSFDTLDAETVQATRVGTDPERLHEALRYIAKDYAERIRIITVLSRANLYEVPALHGLLEGIGIREWTIQLMADHEAGEFGVSQADVDGLHEVLAAQGGEIRVALEGFPYPHCTQPFDTMVINVLGHLSACCTYFSNDYFDFGQVEEQDLMTLFRAERFAKFRADFETAPTKLCQECPYYGRDAGA